MTHPPLFLLFLSVFTVPYVRSHFLDLVLVFSCIIGGQVGKAITNKSPREAHRFVQTQIRICSHRYIFHETMISVTILVP